MKRLLTDAKLAKLGVEWKGKLVVAAISGLEDALKTSLTEPHGAKHVNYSLQRFALKL
jgi:hypothetical protein